jgi:hypothetical protein
MSSQKVEQTREEKFEAILHKIKEWIIIKSLLSSWVDALKDVQRDSDLSPEKKEDWLRSCTDEVERFQRLLSRRQPMFNAKLLQCIDMIALEVYTSSFQEGVTGVLIHPIQNILFHLRMQNNVRHFDTGLVQFTDAGLSLLSLFV